jgi:hypothetical protein
MAAPPKYRFIPLASLASIACMQEVAAQLACETPTHIKGSLYTYRLPERSEEVRQSILKELVRKPPTKN